MHRAPTHEYHYQVTDASGPPGQPRKAAGYHEAYSHECSARQCPVLYPSSNALIESPASLSSRELEDTALPFQQTTQCITKQALRELFGSRSSPLTRVHCELLNALARAQNLSGHKTTDEDATDDVRNALYRAWTNTLLEMDACTPKNLADFRQRLKEHNIIFSHDGMPRDVQRHVREILTSEIWTMEELKIKEYAKILRKKMVKICRDSLAEDEYELSVYGILSFMTQEIAGGRCKELRMMGKNCLAHIHQHVIRMGACANLEFIAWDQKLLFDETHEQSSRPVDLPTSHGPRHKKPRLDTISPPQSSRPQPHLIAGLRAPYPGACLAFQGAMLDDPPLVKTHRLQRLNEEGRLTSTPFGSVDYHFPFLSIHAKDQYHGRTLVELQNHAAVSGTISLKLFDSLHRQTLGEFALGPSPLAFSICTQGPVMELWLHYRKQLKEQSSLQYCSQLISSHNALLRHSLLELLFLVARIVQWAGMDLFCALASKVNVASFLPTQGASS